MKISFNTFSYPKITPQFKSHSGFYRTEDGKEMGTYTWFFRKDLPWKEFTEYETENFKAKNKVNIVQFGASDGTEAFTQIISLLERNGIENSEKFFPIMAYDINRSMVKLANDGYININPTDKYLLGRNAYNWRAYFQSPQQKPYIGMQTYSVEPVLKERVKFQIGDMFKILPALQDNSNTVILCRNCLGYFPEETITDFINTAGNVLKSGSLFAIGMLEEDEGYIEKLLQNNRFEKIMRNVFRKL